MTCATCGGRGWHTAGGNDPMTCSCPAGEAYESGSGDATTPRYTELADELTRMANALALELPEVIHVDVAERVGRAVAALRHADNLEWELKHYRAAHGGREFLCLDPMHDEATALQDHAADLEREVADLTGTLRMARGRLWSAANRGARGSLDAVEAACIADAIDQIDGVLAAHRPAVDQTGAET